VLANNTDRKSGHCLLAHDRVWAIDNGLCFSAPFKLRTVIWEFSGEPIPDELLDRVESRAPIPDRQRRLLVTEVVDLVAEHRQVAAFLTSDPSVSSHLGPDLQLPARAQRFVAITVGAQGSELAAVRSLAALGSVLRPLIASDELVDFSDPATRQLLVACAMAVLKTPLPIRPGSAPSRDRADS